ncbi:MAG: 2-C-methyl-D-erythritol 4-phosphate cytidylyltransferase [Nocardioidaceae bacterium]
MAERAGASKSEYLSAAPRVALVLLAAGSGSRMRNGLDGDNDGDNKIFSPLAGRSMLTWSLAETWNLRGVARRILMAANRDRPRVEALLRRETPALDIEVRTGGATRHESEERALHALSADILAGELDIVVMHDAARPLAPLGLFETVIEAALLHGGALPCRLAAALIAQDSLAASPAGELVAVQTPQAFRAAELLAAYEQASADGFTGTDTASCIERYTDISVHCVEGLESNLKVTYPEDLTVAKVLVAKSETGWDCRR